MNTKYIENNAYKIHDILQDIFSKDILSEMFITKKKKTRMVILLLLQFVESMKHFFFSKKLKTNK